MTDEIQTFDMTEEHELKEHTPTVDSPEWTDWVLNQLEPDEIYDKKPTVDGLRRISQRVIGPIVNMKTELVVAALRHAVAKCTITFLSKEHEAPLIFEGSADVNVDNCIMPFLAYPVAVAETRAEGRALRRALCLKKVITSDEMAEIHTIDPDNPEKANTNQQIAIKLMSNKLGISVDKLLKLVSERYSVPAYQKLDGLSFTVALDIIQRLNSYGLSPDNPEYKEIPEEIKE